MKNRKKETVPLDINFKSHLEPIIVLDNFGGLVIYLQNYPKENENIRFFKISFTDHLSYRNSNESDRSDLWDGEINSSIVYTEKSDYIDWFWTVIGTFQGDKIYHIITGLDEIVEVLVENLESVQFEEITDKDMIKNIETLKKLKI